MCVNVVCLLWVVISLSSTCVNIGKDILLFVSELLLPCVQSCCVRVCSHAVCLLYLTEVSNNMWDCGEYVIGLHVLTFLRELYMFSLSGPALPPQHWFDSDLT